MNTTERISIGSKREAVEMARKARKETEDFLNQWINDNAKGWPVRSDVVNGSKHRFSMPLVTCSN